VTDGLGGERDRPDALPSRGGQLLRVDVHLVLDPVGLGQHPVRAHRVSGGEEIQSGDDRPGRVHERTVLEVTGSPVPRELPPVAHAPRVVALTGAVDGDRLVADGDRPGDPGRDLVARGHRVGERLGPARPLEIEPHRDGRAIQAVERLRRIRELDAHRFAHHVEPLEGLDDGQCDARGTGCRRERGFPLGARQRVVDDEHERASGADERDPPPRQAQVRVQAEPNVPAVARVGRGPVEVPGLTPQLLGT
jgi:hypothetical protein